MHQRTGTTDRGETGIDDSITTPESCLFPRIFELFRFIQMLMANADGEYHSKSGHASNFAVLISDAYFGARCPSLCNHTTPMDTLPQVPFTRDSATPCSMLDALCSAALRAAMMLLNSKSIE